MNRSIKFRGRREDNGEWVYGYLIGTNVIVGDIVEFTDEYFNTEYWCMVDPETVGQYTGLKDRNGKEIYEGDIIQFEELWYSKSGCYVEKVIEKVIYISGRFALHHVSGKITDLNSGVNCHKVIGNCWDHPHLLKRR